MEPAARSRRVWLRLLPLALLAVLWLAGLYLFHPAHRARHVRLLWRREVRDFHALEPASDGGCYILIGPQLTDLLALDANGRRRWRWLDEQTPPSYIELNIVPDGLLLSNAAFDAALLSTDGQLRWRSQILPWGRGPAPVRGRQANYVLSAWDTLLGLNKAGQLVWRREDPDPVYFYPSQTGTFSPTDPIHFLVQRGGELSRRGGSRTFTPDQDLALFVKLDGTLTDVRQSGISPYRSHSYYRDGSLWVRSGNSVSHLATSGKRDWIVPLQSGRAGYSTGMTEAAVLCDDGLVAQVDSRSICLVDAQGNQQWTQTLTDEIYGLAAWGNKIIVLTYVDPTGPLQRLLPSDRQLLEARCYSSAGHLLWTETTSISQLRPGTRYFSYVSQMDISCAGDRLYLTYQHDPEAWSPDREVCALELKP